MRDSNYEGELRAKHRPASFGRSTLAYLAVAKKENFSQNLLKLIINHIKCDTVLMEDCFLEINDIAKRRRTHL